MKAWVCNLLTLTACLFFTLLSPGLAQYIPAGTMTPPVTFTAPTAATIILTLKGAGSHSANLLNLKSSADAILASFDAVGSLFTPQINDSNGNEEIKFTTTGSAVNELTVANAATGNGPTISATGGDSNIDINLSTKGTGSIKTNNRILYGGGVNGTADPISIKSGSYCLYSAQSTSAGGAGFSGMSCYNSSGTLSGTMSYANSGVGGALADSLLIGPRTAAGKLLFVTGSGADIRATMLVGGNFGVGDTNPGKLFSVGSTGQNQIDSNGISFFNGTVTTINGSVAGTIKWSMPEQGTGYKKFIAVVSGYDDVAGATINFPTAFANTPNYFLSNGATVTVTSISTTQIVIPISAGTSGTIVVDGI